MNGFECDESILTGESVPVEKSESTIALTENPSLGDRVNCAFMGTVCTKGKAKGIVTATGRKRKKKQKKKRGSDCFAWFVRKQDGDWKHC